MSFFSTLSFAQKIKNVPWGFILLLTAIASIGFIMLYSAAEGSLTPWALKQMIRFTAGLTVMVGISLVDTRFWFTHAYFLYGINLCFLIAVELLGFVGMGAQRWVDLYVFHFQPSELMKFTVILALAHYFQTQGEEGIHYTSRLIIPVFIISVPALLVLRQPDLGTAMILIFVGGMLLFAAGVRLWIFASVIGAVLISFPFLWSFLRDYQKKRILIFLNPEQDPLGAGYHILQSKIALGSGGFWGKGFMQGTQSYLDFLPEKQTDFIFTMLCEEFGWAGGTFLLFLYGCCLIFCYSVVFKTRSIFSRLLALGVASVFFFHVFINISMVMGLVPVVGVPLPFMSYGGTSMLSLLIGFGLLLSVEVHQNNRLSSSFK